MMAAPLKLDKAGLLEALNNPEELIRLRNLKRSANRVGAPLTSTEDDLAAWLGRLKLLYGVPFNYLVPDVAMLPMESIRFFYCDTTWLDYLTEGALSLGRSTSGEHTHDKAFLGDLHVFSRFGLKRARGKVLGHLAQHLSLKERALHSQAPIPANEKITGFLLRSGVVSGWEGMQVAAFADDEQTRPCQLLRMDHLSPNVLLCMFEGMVKTFRINEYPEVLHFGFDASAAPVSYSKSFRYPENNGTHAAGSQIDPAVAPPVNIENFGRPGSTGVLRINDLAEAMGAELKDKVGYDGPFTSAQFALEMIQGVEAVNYTINLSNS